MMRLILLMILLVGCASAEEQPVPTVEATLVPSLTPTEPPTTTPIPTEGAEVTEQLLPTITTQPLLEIEVEAAEGQSVPPPLTIDLPEGWGQIDSTIVTQDIGTGLQVLPFTAFTGPVTNGQGFIIVLWGFRTIAPGSPSSERLGQFNLGYDGRRLLGLAVTDVGCVIGGMTDLEYDKEFSIGGQVALGSDFSVVQCPESPDTRGWFAGLNHQGVNFVFYAYAEPIEAMDGTASQELQAILDSISFTDIQGVLEQLITPAPEE